MHKLKLFLPYCFLTLSFLICGYRTYLFIQENAFSGILLYSILILFIPLAYFFLRFLEHAMFFLTGLSLGGEYISLRASIKGYFMVPKELKESNKFWVLLLLSRLWPAFCTCLFCALISLTLKENSLWLPLCFDLFVFGLCSLLCELLPLSPQSFPSTLTLIRLLLKEDANKEYLYSIYAINAFRKLDLSYAKIDEAYFLSVSDSNLPESPDNPLFSLLWYHTALKIFANQDYQHFIPYGEHFLKSHPYLSTKKKNLIRANILFSELVTYNRVGKIELLNDAHIRKVLYAPYPRYYALRTRYALDVLYLNNPKDAEAVLKQWEFRTQNIKHRTFIQEEDNLISLASFQALAHSRK